MKGANLFMIKFIIKWKKGSKSLIKSKMQITHNMTDRTPKKPIIFSGLESNASILN